MTAPHEYRYEIKLQCERFRLDDVLTELRLHPAGCRTLHPPRRVQSIYLDTHAGQALVENVAGISDRQKFRFRWYGEAAERVTGTLEKKIRINALGRKANLPIDTPVAVAGSDRREFLRALRAQCPPNWCRELDGLEPAQWIAYEREYFATFDRLIRITVDRSIRTVDLREQRRFDDRYPSSRAEVVIIELKAPADRAEAIREFLQAFPLTVGKSSKFVMASAPAHFS